MPSPSSQRSLVFVLGATSTLAALSIDISLPGLPAIERALHASTAVVQATISAFTIMFGAAQLIVGPLADRFGRRPVLLAGVGAYTAISALCALANDAAVLVAFRLLQGFAACSGVVCARAIVRDISSDVVQGAKRQAVLSAISSLAPMLAPLLGAAILLALGWRWLYGTLAVAGLVFTALGLALVPETRPAGSGRSGVAAAYARVLRLPRTIPLALVSGGTFVAFFAQVAGSSFALERQMHLTPAAYALAYALTATILPLSYWTLSRTVPRFGPVRVLGAGVAITTAVGCVKAAVDTLAPTPVGFVITMLLFTYGIGFVNTNTIALVLEQVKHDAGLAAGLMGAAIFAGASLGSTAVGIFPFQPAASIGVMTLVGTAISTASYLAVRRRLIAETV